MSDFRFLAIVVGCAMVIGLIPAAIAHSKGKRFVTWWILGALLFPFALPAALFMKTDEQIMESYLLASGMRRCPSCGKVIESWATTCPRCSRAPMRSSREEEESSRAIVEAEELIRRYEAGETEVV